MGRTQPTLAERFWPQVQAVESGCWEWTGFRDRDGYGRIRTSRRDAAHRAAWLLSHFVIPEGMHVLHRCDNPPCVNPAHLFLGTQPVNVADMTAKGRAQKARGERNANAKLTEQDVRHIRAAVQAGASVRGLARELGVRHGAIQFIVSGKAWRHVQ